MKKILLIAAFLYFFIAPLTYHPDNKAVLFWASQANGTVWNIWEYGEKHLQPNQQFNYPPLHFYLDKLQYAIAKPIAGAEFTEWLNSPHKEDLFQPQLARYLVAIKFSLILFVLLTGYLIFLLAKKFGLSESRSKLAAGIWLFNPITIYSIPMMGQNDVMAIVFFLGGWLLLTKYPKIAAIIFGLAASIKTYPLIWLAFLLPTTIGVSRKQKLGVFFLSVFVYGLTLLPFVNNPVFRSVGMNSEINNRFLIPQINIGFNQAIYIVPVLLAVVFFSSSATSYAILLTANLLLLGFSHFHPQWYTWIVPFFALWFASQKKRDTIYISLFLAFILIASWKAVIILFADKWLSVGMFGVTNPALGNLPIIRDFLLLHDVNVGNLDNLAHSALAAVGVVVLVQMVSRQFVDRGPDVSFGFFEKICVRWRRISKIFRVFITTLITVGVFGLWIGVTQLVPAPISSAPLKNENFVEVESLVQGNFIVERNNFYRFDLSFKNPNQRNVGKFLVTLSDDQKNLHEQIISGMNIGEETTIRFDIPETQKDSVNHIYSVKVQAIEGAKSVSTSRNIEGYVSTNVTKPGDINTLDVQQFFNPPQDANSVMENTWVKTKQIVGQLPWYYVGLFILLILGS